ncbi:MAG: hypothetical protein Q8922_15235 [Bacteroidota bacterium]|nr:hypothetical protein [Bacteroidota bacterium]MDP4234055.1 hypothetical protein [Bacteroidota bacterium]MDP4242921.1 hypothetical protein [Bacteroidota bacterium]MDP4289270.1 hypothetical protein [Bacteroidota bacterium]
MKSILRPLVIASVVAIALVGYATSSFASFDAYIIFKSKAGKETKVAINQDGTFKSPPLAAGAYRWSMLSQPAGSGSSSREASAPSVSEIARVKVRFHWDRSSDVSKQIGKPKYEDITVTKPVERKSGSIIILDNDGADLTVNTDGDTISGTMQFVTSDGRMFNPKEYTTMKEQLEKNPRH